MEYLGHVVLVNGDALVDLYDPETGDVTTDRIEGYVWPLDQPTHEEETTPTVETLSDDDIPF